MSDLDVHRLVKSYAGVDVLRGLDLHVPSGSLTAVLGSSGCGKTTLLRIIAGFDTPGGGEVVIGGTTVATARRGVAPERRRVGIVPQEGALFPHLTVAGNAGFGLWTWKGRDRARRVAEVLDLAGMAGLAGRMPHELSGGQQQRVAVARALAPRPTLILLDEPFSALDAALRADLRRDVRAALRADGATAVFVTHDQEESLSIADEIAVVRDGVVVQSGPPQEVYQRPADLEVATFLGAAHLLPGTADGVSVTCVLGRLPLVQPIAGEVTAVVRPEQLTVCPPGHGAPARVLGQVCLGADLLTEVALAAGGTRLQVRSLHRAGTASPSERVGVCVSGPVVALPATAVPHARSVRATVP